MWKYLLRMSALVGKSKPLKLSKGIKSKSLAESFRVTTFFLLDIMQRQLFKNWMLLQKGTLICFHFKTKTTSFSILKLLPTSYFPLPMCCSILKWCLWKWCFNFSSSQNYKKQTKKIGLQLAEWNIVYFCIILLRYHPEHMPFYYIKNCYEPLTT